MRIERKSTVKNGEVHESLYISRLGVPGALPPYCADSPELLLQRLTHVYVHTPCMDADG